jgi:hypothetical protein
MITQAELIQLRDDIKNGEIDENQCRDICYDLITDLVIIKAAAPKTTSTVVQWGNGTCFERE